MTDLLSRLDINLTVWFACFCAVTLSSGIQRLSGQAFGIVAALFEKAKSGPQVCFCLGSRSG